MENKEPTAQEKQIAEAREKGESKSFGTDRVVFILAGFEDYGHADGLIVELIEQNTESYIEDMKSTHDFESLQEYIDEAETRQEKADAEQELNEAIEDVKEYGIDLEDLIGWHLESQWNHIDQDGNPTGSSREDLSVLTLIHDRLGRDSYLSQTVDLYIERHAVDLDDILERVKDR